MTSQPKTTCLTPEEYLTFERGAEYKNEQPDGRWLLSDHDSPEDVVEMASIQCALALGEVYEKVALPPGGLAEGELL